MLRSLEAAQQVTSQPSPLMHDGRKAHPRLIVSLLYASTYVCKYVRSAQRPKKRNWKLCVWLGATAKDGEPISSPIDRGRTDVRMDGWTIRKRTVRGEWEGGVVYMFCGAMW